MTQGCSGNPVPPSRRTPPMPQAQSGHTLAAALLRNHVGQLQATANHGREEPTRGRGDDHGRNTELGEGDFVSLPPSHAVVPGSVTPSVFSEPVRALYNGNALLSLSTEPSIDSTAGMHADVNMAMDVSPPSIFHPGGPLPGHGDSRGRSPRCNQDHQGRDCRCAFQIENIIDDVLDIIQSDIDTVWAIGHGDAVDPNILFGDGDGIDGADDRIAHVDGSDRNPYFGGRGHPAALRDTVGVAWNDSDPFTQSGQFLDQ